MLRATKQRNDLVQMVVMNKVSSTPLNSSQQFLEPDCQTVVEYDQASSEMVCCPGQDCTTMLDMSCIEYMKVNRLDYAGAANGVIVERCRRCAQEKKFFPYFCSTHSKNHNLHHVKATTEAVYAKERQKLNQLLANCELKTQEPTPTEPQPVLRPGLLPPQQPAKQERQQQLTPINEADLGEPFSIDEASLDTAIDWNNVDMSFLGM